jgi:hypothetical protein
MERIRLAREYRVAPWLRDAYVELIQKKPLDLEELRPAELYSDNWDVKKWEATSRDWETLARIFHLQTKVAAYESTGNLHCIDSEFKCGRSYEEYRRLCKCRVLSMVNEAFRGELESLREDPVPDEDPLSRKLPLSLPLSYLCPF